MPLDKLPLKTMQAIEPRITKAVFDVLSVEQFGRKAAPSMAAPRRKMSARRPKPGSKGSKLKAFGRLNRLATPCRHNVAAAIRSCYAADSIEAVGERVLTLRSPGVWLVALAACSALAAVGACRLRPGRAARTAAGPAAEPHRPRAPQCTVARRHARSGLTARKRRRKPASTRRAIRWRRRARKSRSFSIRCCNSGPAARCRGMR